MRDTAGGFGFTLWLTGLSGAGKSTLAAAMRTELIRHGLRTEILDGDEMRKTLCRGLGFSREDRDTNIRRIGLVARLLSRNGVVAVVAAISPYEEARRDVRQSHEAPFVEVFVDCAIEELLERDTKGLYAKALDGRVGSFTGISDPYEVPSDPEVVVHSDRETVAESVGAIVAELQRRHLI